MTDNAVYLSAGRFCRRVRRHPMSYIWVLTVGAFAAGLASTVVSLSIMGVLMGGQVAVAAHIVRRTNTDRKGGATDDYP